jgi:hypothetical protein
MNLRGSASAHVTPYTARHFATGDFITINATIGLICFKYLVSYLYIHTV